MSAFIQSNLSNQKQPVNALSATRRESTISNKKETRFQGPGYALAASDDDYVWTTGLLACLVRI